MLDVRGVSKRYGSVRALDDVTMTIGRSEIVAVVGENGAGKSTLVKCVARALDHDRGEIILDGHPIGRSPRDAIDSGVSVVWQGLALCENLDVTANLFLGRELRRIGRLRNAEMTARAHAIFDGLGVEAPDLDQPIQRLSGGQRQLVAIARATLDDPKLLVLDEPTAALGIAETATVLGVVERLRDRGAAIMLVSHRLDEVFEIADRIVVLRHGSTVADVHRAETHPDDIVGFITGVDVDSSAGRQLRRLHSLAEQLSDADEGSILPLTVSSLSAALNADRLAIFMVEDDGRLRCAASLNLPRGLADGLAPTGAGTPETFLGRAAASRSLLLVPDLRRELHDPVAEIAVDHGIVGAWSAPIVGQDGVMAVVAGFTDTPAHLHRDQIRLLDLFSTMAGAAIERGRLVESLGARNRSLVGLRGVLETLAGPDPLQGGMRTALDALCHGVGCDAAGLFLCNDGQWSARAISEIGGAAVDDHHAAEMIAELDGETDRLETSVSEFDWSRGEAAVACTWAADRVPGDAAKIVEGAANSFRLALERELTAEAENAAATLHRTREQERLLTRRLGHELRTPLTAIRGFASTLLQPDVAWGDGDTQRFVETIERESGRMGRMVEQLFDESAIQAGTLRLVFDYCDLVSVITSAVSVAAPNRAVTLDLPTSFTIWGDRDRLEQVFVNLIGNSFRHNDDATAVRVVLDHDGIASEVSVSVVDDGRGMPTAARRALGSDAAFDSEVTGLGLRLVRGFVDAHGGTTTVEVNSGTTVTVRLPIDPAVSCP